MFSQLKGTIMQVRLFVILFLAISVFSGCTKKPRPDGFPELYPCTITIIQDGKPLVDALVRLVPDGHALQWTIAGTTDKNGVVKVITHTDYAGAPEGTFKVCVSKIEITPSQFPQPDKDAPYEEWDKWRGQTNNEKRPKYNLVKPEYNDTANTPHSITISKGKNNATFDVGEAIKEEIK